MLHRMLSPWHTMLDHRRTAPPWWTGYRRCDHDGGERARPCCPRLATPMGPDVAGAAAYGAYHPSPSRTCELDRHGINRGHGRRRDRMSERAERTSLSEEGRRSCTRPRPPAATTTTIPIPALAGLHHVGITVTNLERSVRWYGEMLGLVQADGWSSNGKNGRVVVMIPPGTAVDIGLDSHERMTVSGSPPPPHRARPRALQCDNTCELDARHAYLTDTRAVE